MEQEGYDPLASVQAAGPPGTISFIYGLPDPETFPVEDLRRAADGVLRERPELALQYGPEQGYGPLIDYVRDKVARDEGLEIARAEIMLTGASAGALDHICTLFTRPGEIVLVEAPTYHETIQLFRDHGLRVHQITTDNEGLQVEALEEGLEALARRGERARMLYTIPNFQNPSGITLVAARREPVLALARRYDLLVVEDDVYRDLAYEGQVPASLFATDRYSKPVHPGRVLRIGSFSKILAPGVRLGWLMGPPGLIERLIDSGLRSMGGGANPLMANILADYCRAGLLEAHIEGLRQVYCERRDAMLQALEAHMPPDAEWTRPGGGFFTWLRLPEPRRATEVAAQARALGLLIPVGDPFFAEKPEGQYLRLAFSYVTPEKIWAGVEMLGQVLEGKS
ncbi:MAG: PLP-dependent aminotransferase family protein [Anaerolineae bacterium]|jgi:DNA-binding transcriptional MocR family regulator